MASTPTTPVATAAVSASKDVHSAIYKQLTDIISQTFDLQGATHAVDYLSAKGAASTIQTPAIVTAVLGAIFSYFGKAASIILDSLAAGRAAGQPGLIQLVASALTDILQIPIDPASLPVGKGPDAAKTTNAGIGHAFITNLAGFFAPGGVVNTANPQAGVEAFIGFNMQFAMSTAMLAIIGEAFSLGQIKDVGELGDAMERALGLGRLAARAYRPLLENTVTKPWERQLRAQYKQDLLGARELALAVNRGSSPIAAPNLLLQQHGLSDDQIAELLIQARPKIGAHELDVLVSNGIMTQDEAISELQAAGEPPTTSALRLQVAQQSRLGKLREKGMAEVLSLISKGALPVTAIDDAAAKFKVPDDELPIWDLLAGFYEGIRRRLLAKADILYLYEAGQITLADVDEWIDEAGFDAHDKTLLEFEILGKTADATAKKVGQAKATSAALHARDVAYVTDQFMADFNRPPSADELSAWVGLLDSKQRTRADVRAELLRVAKSTAPPSVVLPGA